MPPERAPRPLHPLVALCAFALGVLWFAQKVDPRTLDPRWTAWLSGDAAWQHVAGVAFRLAPWRFPPGDLPSFPDGVGTSLVYADTIPWVALSAKAVALPPALQYLGPWLGLCFGLQGVFGARLTALWTPSSLARLLGGVLFVLAPPLLDRVGHAALCGHWLLLAALTCALREEWRPGEAAAVLLVAIGVHPYLAAMVAVLLAPRLVVRPAELGATAAAVIATALLLGYADEADLHGAGWGSMSADALTLINPRGHSAWLPDWPVGAGQYEGYAYLGAGGLALIALAGVVRAGSLERRGWAALAAATAMALYALSDVVCANGRVWLEAEMDWLGLGQRLPASGRFVWPLHYLLLALAIHRIARATGPWRLSAALAAALALQAGDLRGWRIRWPAPPTVPTARAWELAPPHYDHLVLDPPQLSSCPALLDPTPLAGLALRLGLTVNSARVARAAEASCAPVDGPLDPRTVYVHLAGPPYPDATCGVLDGLDVCVTAGNTDPFAAALGP